MSFTDDETVGGIDITNARQAYLDATEVGLRIVLVNGMTRISAVKAAFSLSLMKGFDVMAVYDSQYHAFVVVHTRSRSFTHHSTIDRKDIHADSPRSPRPRN